MRLVTKDSEIKLQEHLDSILASDASTWRTCHLNFSQLLEHHRHDYYTKIALNTVRDYVKEGEGGIYLMRDRDVIIICQGITKASLEKMIFRLRYLFTEDPLAYDADGVENPNFCSLMDLAVDGEAMQEVARRKMTAPTNSPNVPAKQTTSIAPTQELRPLTPDRLASVEKDLLAADLSRIMRRQPICAQIPGKPPKRVFDEFYINIPHLRKLIMSNVDFTHNRNLFGYLTQILDAKMLDLLRKQPGYYFDTPISMNLNIATILSDKFAAFDAAMKPNLRVSIIIEIQVADVFADMQGFIYAKDQLQKLGYRVCLDGLNELSFVQVDRASLGFDLAKLQWNSAIDIGQKNHDQKLKKAIERCGANRLILCRCDNQDAVNFGHKLGINLFQGRYLDGLIDPSSKIVN